MEDKWGYEINTSSSSCISSINAYYHQLKDSIGVRRCYDEGKRTAETLTMDYHRGDGVEYTAFDQLQQRLLEGQLGNPQSLSAFLLGEASKCAATCLTYPAIRCKLVIQSAVSGVLYAIGNKEGFLGFYKGLRAQILETVLRSLCF